MALVHHLAADLPTGEVIRLADQVGAETAHRDRGDARIGPGGGPGGADDPGRPGRPAGHAARHGAATARRPAGRVGVASGVFNTSRQAGGALAIAVFGALLARQETFVHGLRVSLLIAAIIALAAAAVSRLISPRLLRDDAQRRKPRRAELDAAASAAELTISTGRRDGTLRPPVPVWVVRADDEILVRSRKGPDGTWFRHASAHGTARISAGRVEPDVTVTVTGTTARTVIDQAYQAKYGRYGSAYVAPMTGDPAAQTTLRLTPTQ